MSSSPEHYQGGTPQEPSLIIRNSSRDDLGIYSCVAQNQIGATQSETVSYVNVLCKLINKYILIINYYINCVRKN